MGALRSPAGGRFRWPATRRVAARHVCAAILCAVWSGAAWLIPGTPVAAQDRKTVWDKVYTEDQATRGKTEYRRTASAAT